MIGFVLSRPLEPKLPAALLRSSGPRFPKLSPPAQLEAPGNTGTGVFSTHPSVKLSPFGDKAGKTSTIKI